MPPVPHYVPHEKVSASSDQTRLTMGAQDESLSSQERQNLYKAPKAAPSPAGRESQSHIRSGFSITHTMLCLCPSSAVRQVDHSLFLGEQTEPIAKWHGLCLEATLPHQPHTGQNGATAGQAEACVLPAAE